MKNYQEIYQKNITVFKGVVYKPCLFKGPRNSYHVQYVRASKIKDLTMV